jgi:hypothetical protein
MISRFVDHVPYCHQEAINARSGVHTSRSTLASWSGRGGAALQSLFVAQRRFVLSARVLHADGTPAAMLAPGAGKTKRAYVWADARGAFDAVLGVIYDFCLGRGSQYPIAFLGADDDPNGGRSWSGTLVRDEYKTYEQVMAAEPRSHCRGMSCPREEEVRRTAARSGSRARRRRLGAARYRHRMNRHPLSGSNAREVWLPHLAPADPRIAPVRASLSR